MEISADAFPEMRDEAPSEVSEPMLPRKTPKETDLVPVPKPTQVGG